MRIVRAQVLEYARKLDGRSWNPVSRWTERRAPLLVLETGEGIRGHAEAWSRQDEIARVHAALARMVQSHVIGRSIDAGDAVAALFETLTGDDWPERAAASAIDMALWDALSRTQQRPLWEMLGGASNQVRIYASGGLYRDGCDVADLSREIARYRDEGFNDIKIKVGGLPLREDVERIAGVRSAMGDRGSLWVDAVGQLDAGNGVESAQAYRDAGADAIQAPVAFDDTDTMMRIGEEALPVVAGEAAYSPEDFKRLLDDARVAFLQINLGLCGGFTGADRIAAMATSRGVPVTVQVHGTAVLLDASLQWGAARGVHSVEFHRFHDHLHGVLGPFPSDVRNGAISLKATTSPRSPLQSGEVSGNGGTIAWCSTATLIAK